uniref:Uncharacterized protein n=1 Tax=Anguilla anguilla TaxID=7936 RepID=A0A0E9XJ69_ANGAN
MHCSLDCVSCDYFALSFF